MLINSEMLYAESCVSDLDSWKGEIEIMADNTALLPKVKLCLYRAFVGLLAGAIFGASSGAVLLGLLSWLNERSRSADWEAQWVYVGVYLGGEMGFLFGGLLGLLVGLGTAVTQLAK